MPNASIFQRQAWIYRPVPDSIFILLPAFLATLMVFLFPEFFQNNAQMPPWAWLLLIVGIDVAHVYSTLWRTYFDPEEFQKYRRPLTLIPLFSFVGGVLLYLLDPLWFWRVLAYLAVYHFVRQQYGFFALYARKEGRAKWERTIDAFTIYGATVYPMLYWHTHLPRNFSWFVEGDFLGVDAAWLATLGGWLYAGILVLYLAKEVRMVAQRQRLNIPKNLILIGTVLSWYYGIVVKNGDLAFTATNVIAHGIPYMALVWMYGKKKERNADQDALERPAWLRMIFRWQFLPLFLGALLVFAYLEEGLWDALVWRDHEGLFPWADALPFVSDAATLAWIVPLLTLPQVTHYVIDGFIWRMRKPDADLKNI